MSKQLQRSRAAARQSVSGFSRYILLAVILLLAGAILWFKNQAKPAVSAADQPAEVQFDLYLQQKKPMLAFFHSTDCYSCVEMMDLVAEVYPQYDDSVELVDVNVYDSANQNLLRRARILSIPTQIFIDENGTGKVIIGVMTREQLEQELQRLTDNAS